jgi:hypothetical protein
MSGIDPTAAPSGTGCLECEESGGWWFHLRRCAQCGHIGCCDSSPSQHASAHFRATGHPVMCSFEPDEDWFWNFETNAMEPPAALTPPLEHPRDQLVPGPADRLPADWVQHLHQG